MAAILVMNHQTHQHLLVACVTDRRFDGNECLSIADGGGAASCSLYVGSLFSFCDVFNIAISSGLFTDCGKILLYGFSSQQALCYKKGMYGYMNILAYFISIFLEVQENLSHYPS